MSVARYITITFPVIAPYGVRLVDANQVMKIIPEYSLKMFLSDLYTKEVVITNYSADEWDVCFSIAEGFGVLEGQPQRIIDIYQKHFK